MHKIVLYCKSYRNDLDRVVALCESITKHNKDNIPFYISVPRHDLNMFEAILKDGFVKIIPDDEIDPNCDGWIGQQIVKSQFWKLGLCENYVCLDSDSEFVRDFYISDFMFDENTPYTICHEHRELFEWADRNNLGFDTYQSYLRDRHTIKNLFHNPTQVTHDFGPSPVIWSRKVWESLEENYIKSNGLTFSQLIQHVGSEFTWYGEWLLRSKAIPLIPRGPLFKVYHYQQQWIDDRKNNIDLDQLRKYYMGTIFQSNWKH